MDNDNKSKNLKLYYTLKRLTGTYKKKLKFKNWGETKQC